MRNQIAVVQWRRRDGNLDEHVGIAQEKKRLNKWVPSKIHLLWIRKITRTTF